MSERDPRRDQSRKRKLMTNENSSNNDDSNNNGNNSEEANVAPEPTPTDMNDSNAEEQRGPNNFNTFENHQRSAYERLVSSVIWERNYFHDRQMQRDLAARQAHNEDNDEGPSPRRARRNDFRSSVQPGTLSSRADSPDEEFLQPRTFYNTPPIIMPAGSVNVVNVADFENLNSPNNSIFNNQRRRIASSLPNIDLSEIVDEPMTGTSHSSLNMNPIFGRHRHNNVRIDEHSGSLPFPSTSQLETNTVSTQQNSHVPGAQTAPTGQGTCYQVNFFTSEGSTRAAQTLARSNAQGRLLNEQLRQAVRNMRGSTRNQRTRARSNIRGRLLDEEPRQMLENLQDSTAFSNAQGRLLNEQLRQIVQNMQGSTRAHRTRARSNIQDRLIDEELRHLLENVQDYCISIENRCPRHRTVRPNSQNRVDTLLATNSAAPINLRGQWGRTGRGRDLSSVGVNRLYFLDEMFNPVEVPDDPNNYRRQYVADPLYPRQISNVPLRIMRNGIGSARSGRNRSRVSSGTLPTHHDYWNRSLHNDSHDGENERQASALVQAGAGGVVNRRRNNAFILSTSRSNVIGFCPICKKRLHRRAVASTFCGHLFCMVCIKRAISLCGKRCPKCRQELRGQCFHRVYF